MKEKSSIKQNIKKIISFCIFILIAAFLLDKLTWLFRADLGERNTILGFKKEGGSESIDAVFIGGSVIYRFYEPMTAWHEKGYTSYDYSTSMATLDMFPYFIRESRTSHKAKLYICDLMSITFVNQELNERRLRNWSETLPLFSASRIEILTDYLFSKSSENIDVPSLYFDIAKYHTNRTVLSDHLNWSFLKSGATLDFTKGFIPYLDHTVFTKPSISEDRGVLSDQQNKALTDLLDYCDKEKISVLFVVCPYFITLSDWKQINASEDIIRARGYDCINLNEHYDEMGLNFETDFGDSHHVNYLGAEKYTKYLVNYISDYYKFADHREDPAYASWNKDYETYKGSQNYWSAIISAVVADDLSAKTVSEKLPAVSDFSDWFEMVQNDNFSVIMVKSGKQDWNVKDDTFNIMAFKWGIDLTKDNYTGVWSDGKIIYQVNTDESYQGKLGVDGGNGTVSCSANAGDTPQIKIGDINYFKGTDGFHLVVFDNNYHKVVDSIEIKNQDGKILIFRDRLINKF